VAIANTARRFQSQIRVSCDGREVDASDVLQLLTLGAGEGAELDLLADGPDAHEAVESLAQLFASNFGMPE
jgi:phosphocarrier protein